MASKHRVSAYSGPEPWLPLHEETTPEPVGRGGCKGGEEGGSDGAGEVESEVGEEEEEEEREHRELSQEEFAKRRKWER